MNIKNINPMDWHNTKLMEYIPKHFVRVKFRHNDTRNEVLAWAEQNTIGRFAIEVVVNHDHEHGWMANEDYQIGFENPGDATMYTMFFR
jgi:hypothetical protein